MTKMPAPGPGDQQLRFQKKERRQSLDHAPDAIWAACAPRMSKFAVARFGWREKNRRMMMRLGKPRQINVAECDKGGNRRSAGSCRRLIIAGLPDDAANHGHDEQERRGEDRSMEYRLKPVARGERLLVGTEPYWFT
ncbi:hypothetical protein ACOJBO_22370 [Rhizobium beringeri]